MALNSVRNEIHFSAPTLPNFNSTLSIAPSMLSQNYRSNLILLAAEATRGRARKNSAEPRKASNVTQLRIRNCKLEIEFTIFFNFQLSQFSKKCELSIKKGGIRIRKRTPPTNINSNHTKIIGVNTE